MSIRIVIGKNYGDEGKGLATDYFALKSQEEGRSCIVVRHNGGAQAGHTVDLIDKRFVFHQLSSGSFRNADTFWAKTFMPDLFKLNEEYENFSYVSDTRPKIFADGEACVVIVTDILVNLALETMRGDDRHGSCGMGIDEAVRRSADPSYRVTISDVAGLSIDDLYKRLILIRDEYVMKRLEDTGLNSFVSGYIDMINDDKLLYNYASRMVDGYRLISVADESIIKGYDDIIFEGAQGLLLDQDLVKNAPHLTSSNTGLINPVKIIRRAVPEQEADAEAVYVTRSYVTRHGAGPLPNAADLGLKGVDKTNVINEWQGELRFAVHGEPDEFFEEVGNDIERSGFTGKKTVLITHLNETDGKLVTVSGKVDIADYMEGRGISSVLLSDTCLAEDIR